MRGAKSGVIVRLQNEVNHLLDVGGCSLHYVHNSVKHACEVIDAIELEQLISDVYNFFRYNDDADYKLATEIMEVEYHKFLRHVETRWLQCLPVIERLLEQYDALVYFFSSLATRSRSSVGSDRLMRLKLALSDPMTRALLMFLSHALKPLNCFEKVFQCSGTMIHSIWEQMKELLLRWLTMFKKESAIDKKAPWKSIGEDEMLPDHQIIIGEETKLLAITMTDNQRTYFYHQVKKFFVECSKQLLHYLPFDNAILKNMRFLDPIKKESKHLEAMAMNVAKKMPNIVRPDDQTQLRVEIRAYKMLDLGSSSQTLNVEPDDLLGYWKLVMSVGQFPIMKRLVQACLIIPHGNSDVERIFSMLSDILTKKRSSLDQQSVKALTFIKSFMTSSKLMCHEVPITSGLRDCVLNARASYHARLKKEAELKEKANEDEKRRSFEERLKAEQEKDRKLGKIKCRLEAIDEKAMEASKKKEEAFQLMEQAQKLMKTAAVEENLQLETKKKLVEKQLRAEKRIADRVLSDVSGKCIKVDNKVPDKCQR